MSLRPALVVASLVIGAASLSAQNAPPAPTTPATPASPTNPASPATPAAPAAPALPSYRPTHAEAMAFGREVFRNAMTGAVDSLVATADPAVGSAADVRARLVDGIAQISMQLGAERRMMEESVVTVNGRVEYRRISEYEMVPVPLVFRVGMGEKGKWRGFNAVTVENAPTGEEVKP